MLVDKKRALDNFQSPFFINYKQIHQKDFYRLDT
jgi:hypothetical protein